MKHETQRQNTLRKKASYKQQRNIKYLRNELYFQEDFEHPPLFDCDELRYLLAHGVQEYYQERYWNFN